MSYEIESYENCSSSSSGMLRPLKMRREGAPAEASSGTAAIVEKLRRFEQEIVREERSDAMILGLCNLTRD